MHSGARRVARRSGGPKRRKRAPGRKGLGGFKTLRSFENPLYGSVRINTKGGLQSRPGGLRPVVLTNSRRGAVRLEWEAAGHPCRRKTLVCHSETGEEG